MGTSVQAILEQHFDAFAARHPLAGYQRDAAWRMRHCRTAAMGGHLVGCPEGHVQKIYYNSCRHRSCPLCAALQREHWLDGWQGRLLDAPHGHQIFTTPHELIPLWRYNKREFANLLFRAATESLRELLADPKYLGALPGMLAALHTWCQTLAEHVHLHVLTTWGGLTPDGRWLEPQKSCLLPRAVLMHRFRGKFLAFLKRAVKKGRLVLPPDTTQARVLSLLNRLGRVDWDLKVLKRYDHGRGVLTYLARYLKGGPITNGRLLDCRDGVVRFRYRDNRDKDEAGRGRRKILPLQVDQFLARLLEHVPPPSFQSVRGYGLYASSKQAELAVARAHFGQDDDPAPVRVTWQDLCERSGHREAVVCPVCGARLVVQGRFPPGRGPPEPRAQSPPTKAA